MTTVQVHRVSAGFVVAVNDQWIGGVYDTEETARRAALHFDDEELAEFEAIYRFDGENRPVTQADLDGLVARRQEECQHEWQPFGHHPDYGTLWECSLCEARTP